MSSMNARFKNLVGSRRRSSNNVSPQNITTPQQQRPSSLSPQGSNNSSSTTSLPAMNPQNPLGRPPSYTYAPPGGLAPQQQQQHGRSTSPMPPPINTGAAPAHGYPPQGQMYQQAPQGPPGYPPQQQQQQAGYAAGYAAPPQATPPAPAGPQSYSRPGAVEVEGAGRSKAQLIVGIDFVSIAVIAREIISHLLMHGLVGNNFLRCRVCVRNKHRSERRHHYGMAGRRKSDETEGMSIAIRLSDQS